MLADPSGILMVDAMDEKSAGQTLTALRALPGNGKIRFLTNTHRHGDHTDGNKRFGQGAIIVAHENVRSLLASISAHQRTQTGADERNNHVQRNKPGGDG